MNKTLNPFESLEQCIAFSSRDWVIDKRDRWIYGIVFGWEDCDDDLHDNYDMSWDEITRLKKLHENFVEAKNLYSKSTE